MVFKWSVNPSYAKIETNVDSFMLRLKLDQVEKQPKEFVISVDLSHGVGMPVSYYKMKVVVVEDSSNIERRNSTAEESQSTELQAASTNQSSTQDESTQENPNPGDQRNVSSLQIFEYDSRPNKRK